MKIVFFGSDDFALVHLKRVINSAHEVCACVTQPDKAKGRGMKVKHSDIKKCALAQDIPVFQPDDLNNTIFVKDLKAMNPDLFIVIAYGRFLPEEVLNIPQIISINVHASLLPRYRGAAPINWAIINGEEQTGLSIIKMNAQMDAGDVIACQSMRIDEEDTSFSLRERMKQISPDFLIETIKKIEAEKGEMQTVSQNPAQVTFAAKITKKLGVIHWNKTSREIHNLVRGLLPWPAAYTYFNHKLLKILESQITDRDSSQYKPGEVIALNQENFIVATQDKALKVLKVHLESSKPMNVRSFLLGHKITPGIIFEESE